MCLNSVTNTQKIWKKTYVLGKNEAAESLPKWKDPKGDTCRLWRGSEMPTQLTVKMNAQVQIDTAGLWIS